MKMECIMGIAVAVVLGATRLLAQGSLSPVGAPGATMKTLQDLQPRTPISSLPFTITESGSYYLTTNLTSSGHGIVVRAAHVTVDLMGFVLKGSASLGYFGVHVDNTSGPVAGDVTIRNGTIEDFGYGVYLQRASYNRLESLRIRSTRAYGVFGYADGGGLCIGNTLVSCDISGTQSYGILLQAFGGEVAGNEIESCSVNGCNSDGIFLYGINGVCRGNRVLRCSVRDNGSDGIKMWAASNNVVQACSVCDQSGAGIILESFCKQNDVRDCLVTKNQAAGLQCGEGEANRIEGNRFFGNGGKGIWTYSGGKNLIVRNICIANASNYVIDTVGTSDTYGPVVTPSAGALSSSDGTASRWVNFSRP